MPVVAWIGYGLVGFFNGKIQGDQMPSHLGVEPKIGDFTPQNGW